MIIEIFTKNENGKIEFTETELKELLDKVHKDGYNEGKRKAYYYTTPHYTSTSPLTFATSTTGTSGSITIKGGDTE